MLKGRDVIHLPIVHPASGQTLGRVADLIVDPEQGRVTELLIDAQAEGGTSRISWSQVQVDQDVIRTEAQPEAASQDTEEKRLCISRFSGCPVMTQGGRSIGQVGDLLIDPSQGHVTGVEVTDGLMQDLLTGRIQLPWPDVLRWSPETIVVADHWQDAWQRSL
ncbi:PRC-barrel domain-containing protein [Heliobacterium chlorum]|uniref:PRC-barrel domain-containing protein n=1 Tax=Heliobacterium chlorum TaxID=2698 RepID=A0ABR7T4C9_HELCL|nr:PRC-barrel domain-containing protein [Heliobacterium chlorum]MBC9785638.1 PRC-barrel domain-containing protein [Heliobacterium chlorum]